MTATGRNARRCERQRAIFALAHEAPKKPEPEVECEDCEGSGACTECETPQDPDMDCEECEGTGECGGCDGSGFKKES